MEQTAQKYQGLKSEAIRREYDEWFYDGDRTAADIEDWFIDRISLLLNEDI